MANKNKKQLKKLTKILGMTPSKNLRLERSFVPKRWWLKGCVEGDHSLPMTENASNEEEAITSFLNWINSPDSPT